MARFANDIKAKAREAAIRLWRTNSGWDALPKGWTFVSLCNDQSDNDPLSELNQLLQSKFITEEQYIGIDRDQLLIEANRRAHPRATWITNDFVCAIQQLASSGTWKPGIVFFDTYHRFDNPSLGQQTAQTCQVMSSCPPSTMLVVNAVVSDRYKTGNHLQNEDAFWKALKATLGVEAGNWEQSTGWDYTSTMRTIMRTRVFSRGPISAPKTLFSDLEMRLIPGVPIKKGKEVFRVPWDHQIQACEESRGHRAFTVSFPPRGGKTQTQQLIAAEQFIESGTKSLVLAPMTMTSRGFCSQRFQHQYRKHGYRIHWLVNSADNLTADADCRSVRSRLEDFLRRPSLHLDLKGRVVNMSGMNAVTTYAAFASFWKYKKNDESKSNQLELRSESERIDLLNSPMFKNITIWFDEFHHIRGMNIDGDDEWWNIIGEFCSFALKYSDASVRLANLSGTPYNSSFIMDAEIAKQYHQCTPLTLLESLHNTGCEIEEIRTERIEYDHPLQAIAETIGANPGYHLVVLPPKGLEWRNTAVGELANDQEMVSSLRARIAQCATWPVRILDATPNRDNGKEDTKKILMEMQGGESKTKTDYDVVLVCRLGRESLDWLPCDHLHVSYLQSEMWESVQTFCRPLSAYPGKKIVRNFYYLPKLMDPDQLLSVRAKTLVMQMQHAEALVPLRFRRVSSTSASEKKTKTNGESAVNETNETEEMMQEILRLIAAAVLQSDESVEPLAVTAKVIDEAKRLHPEWSEKIMEIAKSLTSKPATTGPTAPAPAIPESDPGMDAWKDYGEMFVYPRILRLLHHNFGISADFVRDNFALCMKAPIAACWQNYLAGPEAIILRRQTPDKRFQELYSGEVILPRKERQSRQRELRRVRGRVENGRKVSARDLRLYRHCPSNIRENNG